MTGSGRRWAVSHRNTVTHPELVRPAPRRVTMKTFVRLASACLVISAAAVTQAADSFFDWMILGRGSNAVSGIYYTLKNITDKEALRYGSRTWGINLEWDKNMNMRNVMFQKEGN